MNCANPEWNRMLGGFSFSTTHIGTDISADAMFERCGEGGTSCSCAL